MDKFTPDKRSEIMKKIKAQDTKPEMIVRKLVHGMGYRYRLHRKDLPGHPDLVFPSKMKVIFVNGCFWHQHTNCMISHTPKSNQEYWIPKLKRTVKRDLDNYDKLKHLGWDFLILWECEIKQNESLRETIITFLSGSAKCAT